MRSLTALTLHILEYIVLVTLFIIFFPIISNADIIIFKDGQKLNVLSAWEEKNEAKCKISGIVFGFPMEDVVRVKKIPLGRKAINWTPPETEKVIAESIQYRLVKEDVADIPIETEIVQHIVALSKPTEVNLRNELMRHYKAALARRGFKYHKQPTSVYIYIYGTKEQALAGQGLWIGMVNNSPSDQKPRIEINLDRLNTMNQKPTMIFGLSESKRKQIFREIAAAESNSTKEARRQIPDSLYMKQIDLERKLEKKYKDEIARQYNLTNDQFTQIMVEGVKKGWPMPPP